MKRRKREKNIYKKNKKTRIKKKKGKCLNCAVYECLLHSGTCISQILATNNI